MFILPCYGFNNTTTTLIYCQDGGCTCPGDVAKAIGAGADFVMLGGMLAGHDQVLQNDYPLYINVFKQDHYFD